MNPKERKELAISKFLLILLAVLGLAVVIWLAWIRPSPQAVQPPPQPAPAPASRTAPPPTPATQQYLTITEWDVRAPLSNETYDMTYALTQGESEYATFTFKRLQDVNICTPGVGVAMTRSVTKNQPPYTIDNPEPIATAGNYYYYLAYAGEPCTATATDAQKQVANQIHGGNLTAVVRNVLQKLEAIQ